MNNKHIYDIGGYRCGELVIAKVMNAHEDPSSRGKWRPSVLIYRESGHWSVMALTTLPAYKDGARRIPVPNALPVGLKEPSYLWKAGLTNVSVLDLGRRIGRVDTDLAEAIIELTKFGAEDADALRDAADGRREDYDLAGH